MLRRMVVLAYFILVSHPECNFKLVFLFCFVLQRVVVVAFHSS